MKVFATATLLLATLLVANSNPTDYSDIDEFVVEDDTTTATDRSRHGRILATYEYTIMDNTGRALGKLDGVSAGIGNVSSSIGSLNSALNASNANILDTMNQIRSSVGNGSSIVNTLGGISTSVNGLLNALNGNGTASNSTFAGQFLNLYRLLDTKLSNIEKILGYDAFPPAPAGIGKRRRDAEPEDLFQNFEN